MANTRLTWGAMLKVWNEAGVIIVDDDQAVYAESLMNSDKVALHLFQSEELYCLIRKKDNEVITANGSSVWVTAHNGEELQLSFYRTWVVGDDANLERAPEE